MFGSNVKPFLYLFISGCAGDRHADSQKEGEGCPLGGLFFNSSCELFLRLIICLLRLLGCDLLLLRECILYFTLIFPSPLHTFDDNYRKTDYMEP